jgi:hypothetical protein
MSMTLQALRNRLTIAPQAPSNRFGILFVHRFVSDFQSVCFGDRFAIAFQALCNRLTNRLLSLCIRSRIALAIASQSLRKRFPSALQSPRQSFVITLHSLQNRFSNRFAIALQALRNRLGNRLLSHCIRSKITSAIASQAVPKRFAIALTIVSYHSVFALGSL